MQIINPNLDVPALHKEYMDTGAVIVKELLTPEAAELAFEALDKHVPWELHIKHPKVPRVDILKPDEVANLSDREEEKLIPKIAKLQDNDLSFVYNRFTIPTEESQAADDLLILTRIYRQFNSPEYMKLMTDITGDSSGLEISAWASRYSRHHHLSVHMDEHPAQNRIAAHVLGLTKNWKKEWGGNFAFCDASGKAASIKVPQFNSLVLFKVPRLHLVTQVKPYAQGHRYSLFGWYKATKEYFKQADPEPKTEQAASSDFRQRWA